MLQECGCGAVQHRASRSVGAAHFIHQSLAQQILKDAVRVDAANLIHLRPRHRLAVGNNCQRFKCGLRKALAATHAQQQLKVGRDSRRGCKLHLIAGALQAQAACCVVLLQLQQSSLHCCAARASHARQPRK